MSVPPIDGAGDQPLEKDWSKKKKPAGKKKSGGGVAIALMTLLLLLGGFGYVIWQKLKKSPAAEVAQGDTPPADPNAAQPGDPNAPAVVPAGGQGDPTPATPAVATTPAAPTPAAPIPAEPAPVDPLANINIEPQPTAPAAPAIPVEEPVIANAEPVPLQPDPAGDPLLNAEPAPVPTTTASATPLPMEIPDEPEIAAPGRGAANLRSLETEPIPATPAAPALEPEPQPIELRPRPAPLAEPVPEEPPVTATGPATPDRLGSFEPIVEEDAVVVPTGPAATNSRLPSARRSGNKSDRYGDFEPDPEAPRPARINTIGGEAAELAQAGPTSVNPGSTIIQRRQPTPAPATASLEPLPAVSAAQPGVAPAVPQQIAPAGIYTVAPNDNFWVISKKVYGTARPFKALTEHFRAAGLDPQLLRPGIRLAIPPREQLEATYPQLIDKAPSAFLPAGAANSTQIQPVISGAAPVVAAGAAYEERLAPAAAPSAIGDTGVYTVVQNDSFYEISRKVYGTARMFTALNAHFESQGITTAKLRAGMQLPIPPRQELEARYPDLVHRGPAATPAAAGSPVLARGKVMTAGPSFGDSPVVAGGPTLNAPTTVSTETEDAGGFYVDQRGLPMYKVGSDDTLTSISQRFLGRASRWSEIYDLNQAVMKTPDQMRPGLVLQLPGDASRLSEAPGSVTRN